MISLNLDTPTLQIVTRVFTLAVEAAHDEEQENGKSSERAGALGQRRDPMIVIEGRKYFLGDTDTFMKLIV